MGDGNEYPFLYLMNILSAPVETVKNRALSLLCVSVWRFSPVTGESEQSQAQSQVKRA